MMTQRSAPRRSLNCSLAAAIAVTACLSGVEAARAEGPSNEVKRIEARPTAGGREVLIHTARTPTFSVFRLSDPFRILVDVSDATVPETLDLMKFEGDPVLEYVSTTPFVDESSSIVRIEIALDAKHAYDVRAEGNVIVARIEAPDAAPGAEKAAAGPSLGKLAVRGEGRELVLAIPFSGAAPSPETVSIMELESPNRVVIDLIGATAEPRFQRVDVKKSSVVRARVASNEDGVRMVLDLAAGAALPEVNVDAIGGELRVSILPPRASVAPVAAAPAPEAKPAAVPAPETKPEAAPAPAPKKAAAVARVTDVRFEPKRGFLRLTIDVDGDVAVSKDASSTRETPVIRLSGASLPEALVRTLDTSAVAGEVLSSISSYPDGADVLVAAQVGDGTEHRHWRKGNRLIWDFRGKDASPVVADASADTARVLPYAERATSGFESSAAIDLVQKTATGRQRYRGRRISLDLKDAEILNVLRLLADVSKLNIVAADDVSGKVTLKLRNVPWDQALDIILQAKKLDKTRNGNIIRVAPITVLEQEEQLRLSRLKAQEQLEPLSVRLIPVNYADATKVKDQIAALLSARGKVNVDARTNVLVVEDIAEVLLKSERLVRTLDTQTPQVLIEARIVEAATNFVRDLGIQWGGQAVAAPAFGTQTGLQFPNTIAIRGGGDDAQTPTAGVLPLGNNFAVNLPAAAGLGSGGALGFVFGSAGGSALLSLRLTAAEQQGKTKIISAPKVVTMDNTEAKIQTGEKIPITVLTANGPSTRFVDANLSLTVTPHVTSDGSVMMKITATKNELSQRQDILGTPGIITREASTEMLVRDGDTAVLGGIYRRTASQTAAYVPWIGQIPVLGWLFKKTSRNDSREELLIFISPRIVNRSQALVTAR